MYDKEKHMFKIVACFFFPGGRRLYIWTNLGNELISKGIVNLKYYVEDRNEDAGKGTQKKEKKKVNINIY